MEAHNDITTSHMLSARKEIDKFYINQFAEREHRINLDDGMIIKIPEENILDRAINSVDKRRLVLEKKASIIHDYYGDSLVGKDIMKDYLSSKKWYSGVANGLSLALLSVNLYSKVLMSSVFMGKVGTTLGLIAIQSTFRYLSNNSLEKSISRPWKVHTYRMEKGLGPTNVATNYHPEKLTNALSFVRVETDLQDTLTGSTSEYIYNNPYHRSPPELSHWLEIPDQEDMNRHWNFPLIIPERTKLTTPKKDDKMLLGSSPYDLLNSVTGLKTGEYTNYQYGQELFKELLNGHNTLYKPSPLRMEPFTAESVGQQKLGFTILSNEFLTNRLTADASPDLPTYSREFMSPVNITSARLQKFLFHWRLRLYFKSIKKEYTTKLGMGDYSEEYNERLREFSEEVAQKEHEFKLKNINVIDFVEPLPNYILHNKEDQNALYEYWRLVYSQRPTFVKHQEQEVNYDFDFPIDSTNYDPWVEYKLLYKDIFTKGRQYWLLKAMPDFYFLQIGRPAGKPTDFFNQRNPQRPNMRDSIFNIMAIERWQDERREKHNIYVRDSQSIRI